MKQTIKWGVIATLIAFVVFFLATTLLPVAIFAGAIYGAFFSAIGALLGTELTP